jgi:hypothetical protein
MLPFGILVLLFVFIAFYGVKILLLVNTPPQQTVIYTKLFPGEKIPPPVIDVSPAPTKLSYILDTIDERVPTATLSAAIFPIPPSSVKIGYSERLLAMGKTFGIDTDTVKYRLDGTNAFFDDGLQKLTVDTATFNYEYQYDVTKDPNLFTNTQIPSEDEITQKAIDFMQKIDRYPAAFAQSKPVITYYTYNPKTTELKISDSAEQTSNMVEVDFFRPDISANPDNISTVTSKFPHSSNYIAMVFTDQDVKVVKSQIKFFDIAPDQQGVYPLKTGPVAWQDLQDGNAYIISAPPNQSEIIIKRIFLAYYEPDIYQPYMEPVYVFMGDNNFVAYVPAIDSSLLAR